MLNWSDTEQAFAAGTAMAFETWKLKKLSEALGGKKGSGPK